MSTRQVRVVRSLVQDSLTTTELRSLHQYNTTDTATDPDRTIWERNTVKAGEHNPLALYSNDPQATLNRKYQTCPLEMNIAGILTIQVQSLEPVSSDFQRWYMTYYADKIKEKRIQIFASRVTQHAVVVISVFRPPMSEMELQTDSETAIRYDLLLADMGGEVQIGRAHV